MAQGEQIVDMEMNIVLPTLYPSMKTMSGHLTFNPYL